MINFLRMVLVLGLAGAGGIGVYALFSGHLPCGLIAVAVAAVAQALVLEVGGR